MDNIDWWAVLNAPSQPEQPSVNGFRGEAVNERHQASPPANLVRPVGGTQDQRNQDTVNFGRSSDSWQSREAELLTYLSQANNHPHLNGSHHQQQSQHQVQSETAFQGLPDWLFPPAINSGPSNVPTPPTYNPSSAPPHWTTYAEAPSLTRHDTQPQSTRGQSQGSSLASSPIISAQASPAPLSASRYPAYSPTQLQDVSPAEARTSRSDSIRPQTSRSTSVSGGIEPEDAEDKRSRNTQASARFRAKKKQQSQSLQRGIEELEGRHAELERDVHDLKRENGFLKDMVMLKWGNGVATSAGVDSPNQSASTSTPKSASGD